MARTFHKGLNINSPCPLYEFTECDKFHKLRAVGGIGNTAGTHAVSKAQGHVIFFCDLKKIIIFSIERIVFLIMQHPGKGKRASTAHDIHYPVTLAQTLKGV